MAQKFEICAELCWKTIKHFMLYHEGIDVKTPKQVIKEFYLSGFIDEDKYKMLMKILDDRNKLSHIYNEDEFKQIINSFIKYSKIFKKIIQIISKSIKK